MSEGPKRVASNQRLVVASYASNERRHGRSSFDVRRNDGGISEETSPLRSCEGGASESRAKLPIGCNGKDPNKIKSWTDAGVRVKLGPFRF